jgi:hypothetical protein
MSRGIELKYRGADKSERNGKWRLKVYKIASSTRKKDNKKWETTGYIYDDKESALVDEPLFWNSLGWIIPDAKITPEATNGLPKTFDWKSIPGPEWDKLREFHSRVRKLSEKQMKRNQGRNLEKVYN